MPHIASIGFGNGAKLWVPDAGIGSYRDMESTAAKPSWMRSNVCASTTPIRLTNRVSLIERTWKQSAADALLNLFLASGASRTIQGAWA